RRAGEFVMLIRRLCIEDKVTHRGEFYRLDDAILFPKPRKLPEFYLAGASQAAKKMAAAMADVYLMSAEPLDDIRRRMDELRELSDSANPNLRFGIAGTVICRDTHEEAWAHAQAM